MSIASDLWVNLSEIDAQNYELSFTPSVDFASLGDASWIFAHSGRALTSLVCHRARASALARLLLFLAWRVPYEQQTKGCVSDLSA